MKDWAEEHIERLKRGHTVQFRPIGESMTPRVRSGQLCTVAPVDATARFSLKLGDIVLCRVRGSAYLHQVSDLAGTHVEISNAHGRVNGWTPREQVFGKLVTP